MDSFMYSLMSQLLFDFYPPETSPVLPFTHPSISLFLHPILTLTLSLSSPLFPGGTSRVSIVKRKLGEILGLDPSAMNFGLKTTMNSDEAVARGERREDRTSSIPFPSLLLTLIHSLSFLFTLIHPLSFLLPNQVVLFSVPCFLAA